MNLKEEKPILNAIKIKKFKKNAKRKFHNFICFYMTQIVREEYKVTFYDGPKNALSYRFTTLILFIKSNSSSSIYSLINHVRDLFNVKTA